MSAAACRAVVVAFAPLRTATFPLHLDIVLVVSSNARALNRTERALLSCSVIWFAYVCTSPFVHSIFGAADVVRPERIALPYWTFPCPCVFPAPNTIEPMIDLSYAPSPIATLCYASLRQPSPIEIDEFPNPEFEFPMQIDLYPSFR